MINTLLEEYMTGYTQILEGLSPCGLDCSRCAMRQNGKIAGLSAGLLEALSGFEKMAPKVADRFPAMHSYQVFTDILKFFGQAGCGGCRAGGAQLPFCAAKSCFKEKEVDFCHQCKEYPCSRNQYPPSLEARWRDLNDRMKEIGVEEFYREQKARPRY